MEGAVASEHDHPLVTAQCHLCADGCTVAEAHGAQTAAGDEAAALGVADILCCPHLVLAHVGDIDGLGAEMCIRDRAYFFSQLIMLRSSAPTFSMGCSASMRR